ncbi:Pentatricopeptide repeat-containing protein [Actinidia chinensis var. chinensis]|uniref:Pentatricopeptide repeat-containing protein n=1 Tax=Actinidia chinensis var. chinensis TaxID=1590841 RepID=A0A2R6Q5A1_ACTCC|nr:Pentatricopeptide repeat-containing protein [Actinidia chinensis var. chinensis]
MLRIGVSPDHLTYPFVCKACARLMNLNLGLAIHCCVLKTGFESDRFIRNSLIHLYASCGNIVCARKVFDEMHNKNMVSWNAMLDGYAKCGDMCLGREVFDLMPERDVVSWSSLIDGYVKDGQHREALAIFERMKVVGPKANDVTMVSVLCACAHLGALEHGRTMHRYMLEKALPLTLELQTSLVDMYAKCGAIEDALVVFRGVSKKQTDVLVWNAMIGGLATHGFVMESFDMFSKMRIAGITPDEITYLCLLSACVHGGLVKEAWSFFKFLNKDGMTPKSEHYACMVDVLARAGQLTEAYQFLHRIPVEPTASMLGALFNGCMNHRKLDLAEIVGRKLVELEPEHDGRYVGLSNAYAVIKRWAEAKTMREAMERRGMKKSPGLSFVEVFGKLHSFIAHDKTHPETEQIYMMLTLIVKQMKVDADSEIPERELYDMEIL